MCLLLELGSLLTSLIAAGDNDASSCRGFCSIPGPLQSVQRAGMWGVMLALQSSSAIHLGVDNLGVVRHVGCLLDGRHGPTLFEKETGR